MVGVSEVGAAELKAAIPDLSGTLKLKDLEAKAEVYRDDLGIPHVCAENEHDAFFAQGFATAQDRLWHMEYDRLRGSGRWSEAVGDAALEQDKLMRRFRLTASARADCDAMDEHTRMVFDAYAAGVNAFIDGPDPLPAEYAIAGIQPEPWQPWHSLVVYKVRHILMGVFESKVWRARMVLAMGPERAGKLFPGYEPGHLLILPPGQTHSGPLDQGLKELAEGAAALNYLQEIDSGSNSWVVGGQPPAGDQGGAGVGTATGKPILAGDSHRALDTPNAYYQNRISCPEFDVTGLSFPGVPAFPHFGHNPWVCWSVTHTAADYQDLYIEQLRDGETPQYLHKDEWHDAEVHEEIVRSSSGREESVRVVVTNHGPVISGGPPNNPHSLGAEGQGESGTEWTGMALKYTATESASQWPSILWQMLRARSAVELVESQRRWVDPCNNFLFADVDGNFGYLCRGRIPIRSRVNGWLPVPGWTGEHEWEGDIPFDELPRSINPPEGYIATANNKPVSDDYPYYIAVDFTPEFRVSGVTQGLKSLNWPSASDMAGVHAYRISQPALAYLAVLPGIEPQDALSAIARERLLGWDGAMDAHRIEPTIYSAMRDALLKELLERNLPLDLAHDAWHPADRGLGSFGNRLKARMVEMLRQDDRSLLAEGDSWPAAISRAMARGVAALRDRLGDDPDGWRWDRIHRAVPRHTLSGSHPDLAGLLDPQSIPHSGDGDTPLQGGYSPATFATVTSLSVARYSYDTANWDNSLWVVPLGSSGHPGSPHYDDQSETWRNVEMVPMRWDWEAIIANSKTHQTLEPE